MLAKQEKLFGGSFTHLIKKKRKAKKKQPSWISYDTKNNKEQVKLSDLIKSA